MTIELNNIFNKKVLKYELLDGKNVKITFVDGKSKILNKKDFEKIADKNTTMAFIVP